MVEVNISVDMHEIYDFGAALEGAVAKLPALSNEVNLHIAEEIVQSARSAAYAPQMRKAAQSLSSVRSGKGAEIDASIRWFNGAELGAIRYHQFPSWRGTIPRDPTTGGSGYFLFPTIRANAQKYVEEFGHEFLKGLNPPFH